MKKIISLVLVLALLISTVNATFVAEITNGEIVKKVIPTVSSIKNINIVPERDEGLIFNECAKIEDVESCIPSKDALVNIEASAIDTTDIETVNIEETYSASNFAFNSNLITSFNTITGPIAGNGANEPKFSYNSFLEENISDYSGELTLNFEDLVLDGRNGLDLRIGRTYQSVAANVGEKTIIVLPASNGTLINSLVEKRSTYLLDRYNLGMGWGFSFPSVQVETEYVPQENVDTYLYEEETELYYHEGNGNVYQVKFTSDTTDSNLKGYYNKDIQFNHGDTTYSNGQVSSYYSMTLSDKTKQYFAKDGRLIGIVDRFGNTIKFEHELKSVTNIVPQGTFAYTIQNDANNFDGDMWFSSASGTGSADAEREENASIESHDGYVMRFKRDNENGDTYIVSQPIQIKPSTDYELGIRIKSEYGADINIDIIGYDVAYNPQDEVNLCISDCPTGLWYDFSDTFSMSSAVRYIQIKISPDNAEGTYIDTVTLDEPKPLLKRITDSIGRTIDFVYAGDTVSGEKAGAVVLNVTAPDGSATRTLTYNKSAIAFSMAYAGHGEQRTYWYLNNSNTEGEDGSSVHYGYEGGLIVDSAENATFQKLYSSYVNKTQTASDGYSHKPLLSSIHYKDRKKIYEYEKIRKHLGDDGYYDTLRIKKKYDNYSYVPEGSSYAYFKGEIGAVNYSYSGTYNGNSFNNETGYPNYFFDDETTLNEQWMVTKTGKSTDTSTFSNCELVQQTRSFDGTTVAVDYTNHTTFKNSPTQIKNTTSQNDSSKTTYVLYSYNDWGGLSSETKEVDESIINNTDLLEKYTTTYQYDPEFHYITQKGYYNNIDTPAVWEINIYDDNGLLISTENAVREKTNYYYENTEHPFLVTKTVMDDPMGFQNVIGGDKIVNYTYDSYGLYPITVSETYENGIADTHYKYDYITGDILLETLPDNSQTTYTYYSDGRVNIVASPLGLSVDGKEYFTIDQHIYGSNYIATGYSNDVRVFDKEEIIKYIVFTDENIAKPYQLDLNFYDAVGNLKQSHKCYIKDYDINAVYLKSTTQYYHDEYDRLIKTIDNDGNAVTYSYDGFDRPVAVADSENNIYTYKYDAVQNKVDLSLNGITEATDRQLMTQYFDLYGNVVKNVVYPDNSTNTLSETYEYDLNNNTVSYTNANGNKTEYSYDAADRLRKVILPNGVVAGSTYSSFDETTFEKIYDENGNERLARITYRNEKGDLRLKFFNYDSRMVDYDRFLSDAKGRITDTSEVENPKTFAYDELDHPVISTSGASEIHRRYDRFGEISSASNDNSITEVRYGYDYVGNLSVKLQNRTHYVMYAYSGTGKILQSLMPSERLENYTYTPNGSLDTIVSDGNTFDYDYYDTGYVKSISYPNGLKTSYEYDNINRVTKVITTKNGTSINTFEYEYDNNGNTTKETRNGVVTAYSYDSLDRLISIANSDGSSVVYEYDALNNRTKETYSNGDIKDYVYDEKYQLKEIKLNGKTTDTFKYNETGAVVKHNEKTYTYDEWDRMSGYTDGTDTYTYKYDANGIRTQKNDKEYIVDINNNVVAEADGTGAITNEILWGHQPLARKINGSWYYYIYNAHGDVVGLVDDAGTVVNSYEYDPWGNIISKVETVDNPIKYAGEYYDDELDMIYLRARYYNPQIGRFTSHDIEEGEILNPLDMNRYVYCRNNPIKYVDPTGESAVLTCIIVGAAIGTVVGGTVGGVASFNKYGTIKYQWVAGGMILGGASGALIGWGAGAVVAKLGVVGAATGIINGGGAAFTSFDKLKQFLGSPGVGKHWHHIVEQCQSYSNRAGFSVKWIQNTNNVVAISKDIHQKISSYYSSVQNFTNGLTVRNWLNSKSFEEQYKFGIKVLEMFGIKVSK